MENFCRTEVDIYSYYSTSFLIYLYLFLEHDVISTSKFSSFHQDWNIIDVNDFINDLPWQQSSVSPVFMRIDFEKEIEFFGIIIMDTSGEKV